MPPSLPLLVFVSMFAPAEQWGIRAFHLHPKTGELVAAKETRSVPHPFFLALSPDGRFLFGTNRGHDSIAIFRIGEDGLLTPVDIVPSLGKGPQNLAITPDGSLLLCANMPGNNVAVFRIDAASGRLAPVGVPVAIASPACITIVP